MSPVPYGKSAVNERVEKYCVVNSDTGSLLRVGHGRVTVPFLLTLTLPWFSPITFLTILFASSEIYIPGSGKSTLECIVPSTSPGLI